MEAQLHFKLSRRPGAQGCGCRAPEGAGPGTVSPGLLCPAAAEAPGPMHLQEGELSGHAHGQAELEPKARWWGCSLPSPHGTAPQASVHGSRLSMGPTAAWRDACVRLSVWAHMSINKNFLFGTLFYKHQAWQCRYKLGSALSTSPSTAYLPGTRKALQHLSGKQASSTLLLSALYSKMTASLNWWKATSF